MKYSEQVAMAEVGRKLQTWLRGNPGPISGRSPTHVYEVAVKRFSEATGVDCECGQMVDHLFSVGIQADQVGDNWWLRIPGKNRYHLQIVNTPNRIA